MSIDELTEDLAAFKQSKELAESTQNAPLADKLGEIVKGIEIELAYRTATAKA
jgi:hypothetical protein